MAYLDNMIVIGGVSPTLTDSTTTLYVCIMYVHVCAEQATYTVHKYYVPLIMLIKFDKSSHDM